ncbi:MAG: hypothetical protein K0Q59_1786 [Paenibacillus sp.]|nr:hypothetical protein [Paenibacillus sp.]
MQHYAITKYGTSKSAPFALVRFDQGVFEIFSTGNWEETTQYDGILTGDFSEYDAITAKEAEDIIQSKQQ